MINGVNHITISVKSIETAFLFYSEILELKPIMKSSKSAYFTAGETWIALVKETSFEATKNYAHIAFNVSKEDFETFCKKLIAKGVIQWQENTSEGESLYLLDDSGNKLEIHYSNLEKRIKNGKEFWGKDIEWFV